MSTFDSFGDVSFQLKTEGETITLRMKQGIPSDTDATIEWNIPQPALGCENDGVYSGMLILLHTKPLNASNIPQNGTTYVPDPTANLDIHAGDKIGEALVIGALYECNKKGAGEALTTSLIVSDLKPGVGYYIAGYALDCQNRYHSDGVRAYSDHYGKEDGENFAAEQVLEIKNGSNCIIPTDGTGLLPGAMYQFDLVIDNTYPLGTDFKVVEFNIDGNNAGTYEDLLSEINTGIALVNKPPTSPVAPNSGQFYWNDEDQTLFSFDGTTHTEIPVLVEPVDPSVVVNGGYWFDTNTKVLSRWNIPSPTGWNVIPYIISPFNPITPSCDSYWIDDLIARRWNGTIWCDLPTNIQQTDPDCCNTPQCGAWWYDEINLQLNEWNVTLNLWDQRDAIFWPEPPNQLSNGTYWFNLTSSELNVLAGLNWMDLSNETNVFIQIDEPPKVDGVLWYNTELEELRIYVTSTSSWDLIPVLVWSTDPSIVESCDAWWRSTDDMLLLWDVITNDWIVVDDFTIAKTDPVFPSKLEIGQVWYNPVDNIVNVWDGGVWVPTIEFIVSTTNPMIQTLSNAWFDTVTGEWNIWDTPNVGWNIINPVDVIGDPLNISTGTYWFDITQDILQVRNGLIWMNVTFSFTPLTPTRRSQWFNSTTKTLLEWDGTSYVPAILMAEATFNECGITILTTQKGSTSFTMIPVMNHPGCTASGFADFRVDGAAPSNTTCGFLGSGGLTREYPVRHLTSQAYLWDALKDTAIVGNPIIGNDGVPGTLSYDTIGVGDDGTPDERRELAYSIRAQLGYPVVEVELTPYQLDTAIQGAIESLRKRSSMAYRRGFFFIDVQPQQQNYVMTNKQIGYNKIVTITSAYRFTSAFLSTAHGGGVYGQVVLQHLYNMGTYDLTSFHLVSQYVEQLQDLFATRLLYNWDESTRQLGFYQSFTSPERILLDCQVERTEQDLMTDRYTKTWIERYALAESMTMLARVRGKYGSLPGAGGGVSLDASDLMATADVYRAELIAQLDDYIVQDMEGVGMNSAFIFGG